MSGKAIVDALADHWGKMLAAVMLKLDQRDITLTPADLERLNDPAQFTLVPGGPADPRSIRIRVMPLTAALAEAQKHKEGFGRS